MWLTFFGGETIKQKRSKVSSGICPREKTECATQTIMNKELEERVDDLRKLDENYGQMKWLT